VVSLVGPAGPENGRRAERLAAAAATLAALLPASCNRTIEEDEPVELVEHRIELWWWARQEDGTDACAEEWFVIADCFDGLTCEEHLSFFRKEDTGN
jgi:hypothetical protein